MIVYHLVGFQILGGHLHSWRDNKQMAAIAEIERLGGHVDFVPSGVQVKVVVMSAVRSVVELTPSDSVPTLSPKRL